MSDRGPAEGGFSLLEAVISLALIGLALFTAVALLLAHPRAVRQIEAERELLAVAEAAIEAARSGVVPLVSSDVSDLVPRPTPEVVEDLSVRLVVREDDDREGLFHVSVVARGTALNRDLRRQIDTMVWRAP
jgi:type II secretory pathway pseudopilin PulG